MFVVQESARQSVEEQLSSSREEHTILKERAEVADTAVSGLTIAASSFIVCWYSMMRCVVS